MRRKFARPRMREGHLGSGMRSFPGVGKEYFASDTSVWCKERVSSSDCVFSKTPFFPYLGKGNAQDIQTIRCVVGCCETLMSRSSDGKKRTSDLAPTGAINPAATRGGDESHFRGEGGPVRRYTSPLKKGKHRKNPMERDLRWRGQGPKSLHGEPCTT